MNSRGGINAAEVRPMKALQTRFFEVQPPVLQRDRRRGTEDPGVRSESSVVVVLRFGPAMSELRGEDALDAEVRQPASVHESSW